MDITKHTKCYNFIESHLLSILLVVFYISEGYSKYVSLNFHERPDITKIIKLGVMMFILASLIKNYQLFIQLTLIISSFILGQLFISPNFNLVVLGVFLKYIFPLLLFAYFNKNRLSVKAWKTLQNTFESVIIFNSVLIVIGIIFEIQLFKTYGGRFGYNGLFVTSASGTYAYLVTMFYFLFKNKKAFIYDVKSIIIMISCLLIGTKSLYLTLGLVLMFYFILFTNKKQRILGLSLMSILLLLGIYYTLFIWDVFNSIWLKDGLLTSVLSYRNELFLERTLPFIEVNWSFINYLFGGVNSISTRSQMGFIDIFYFFGTVGGGFYLWVYTKTFIKFKINRGSLLFLFLLCDVIFISGNFFLNASVVIYLLIVRESLLNYDNDHKIRA